MSAVARSFAWGVLLAGLASWQPARADDAVSVELVGKAMKGQGQPRLVVSVRAALSDLVLELERPESKPIVMRTGRVAAGATKTFELTQREGSVHYRGRLVARFPRGPAQELPLEFDTHLCGPPSLTVKDDAVDLAARTVAFALDREPASVHVKVVADDGRLLADYDRKVEGVRAGEPVRLGWEQPEGAVVLRVSLRASDANGYYQDVELFPWKVEIPHEDVLFDSGRSEILEGERGKLDAALAELAGAVQRYGKVAAVQLFVAGFTDTVGDAAANQQLSSARALAIARYFRQRGLRIGIHHAGLGEALPAVATPDETPEPRNRRATYTIAVEPPAGVRWARLP
jgi:outer membrane protein OmpA-like peptidoglycan-associated protein